MCLMERSILNYLNAYLINYAFHYLTWYSKFYYICTVGCLNVPKVLKYMQPFEVYLVPYVVAFSEKNLFTKLDMVQMIWTFDIFMTKLQNCKNNLVQNSDTRRTMIYNCLKMVILRPLEIIVPLVSEFWTKLFLQFWSFVMKISKVQIIWTMSSVIF